MNKKEVLNLFHRSLLDDTKSATELLALLVSTRLYCIEMQSENLQLANIEIIKHVEHLEKNHAKRLKIIDAFKFPNDITAFLNHLPISIRTEVTLRFNELISILKYCEEKNQGNGNIFSQQHEMVANMSKASLTIRI
ncbi:hypothetical protein [Psychromonas sp. Urea-02u-13]|uniref:hypothetical protein n=1 Tax=Psychromonas sp. Urea-02u-13 TaxID=2058326 RepID=UPI000C33A92B|nr:hypothetical protein [Psychromonas sp. Urea-02u-13]PKG39548.1 hypothetical protein CXF74_07740 [Psychromonas sp. Urea-02u-13]